MLVSLPSQGNMVDWICHLRPRCYLETWEGRPVTLVLGRQGWITQVKVRLGSMWWSWRRTWSCFFSAFSFSVWSAQDLVLQHFALASSSSSGSLAEQKEGWVGGKKVLLPLWEKIYLCLFFFSFFIACCQWARGHWPSQVNVMFGHQLRSDKDIEWIILRGQLNKWHYQSLIK